MDDFLDEIPSDLYGEWLAFDHIEPLDPAGMILKGLSGGEKKQQETPDQSWRTLKQNMMQHIKISRK